MVVVESYKYWKR